MMTDVNENLLAESHFVNTMVATGKDVNENRSGQLFFVSTKRFAIMVSGPQSVKRNKRLTNWKYMVI